MKRFWRVFLSRTFLIGLMVLVQLIFYSTIFVFIDRSGSAIYTIISLAAVIFAMVIFERDNLNGAYRMMWLLIIIPLPIAGLIYYFLFGKRPLTPKRARLLNNAELRAASLVTQNPHAINALIKKDTTLNRSAEYLATQAASPVYSNTLAKYYPSGEVFFEEFLQELSRAQKYIFMEYFIIDEDSYMWGQILGILKEKAVKGVDVRILYDSFGCIANLPTTYPEQLDKFGIKCRPFNDLHLSLHISDYKFFNHRDHRKITVIDGETAFSGGLNFADEYINRISRFGYWKDSAFCIKGPAVYKYTTLFLSLWDFTLGTATNYEDYKTKGSYESDGFIQPYGDSPLDYENVSENMYFNVINRAKDYVYIATPYLIIDSEMFACLTLAAKSGVDVRIITPAIPDKQYAFHVTQSYYFSLLKAGVRIFEYTPGFMHAKMYVSDDTLAIVGSANMDYRSLYLHFESCCAFYHCKVVKDVRDDIRAALADSREVTLEEVRKTPLAKRVARIFFRMFAPMM